MHLAPAQLAWYLRVCHVGGDGIAEVHHPLADLYQRPGALQQQQEDHSVADPHLIQRLIQTQAPHQ